jgi:biopolymer transport protein ExbD
MKFRRKKRPLGGIPTASMPDVAFLLLVFFLTTTTFDIKKGLGLVLPPPAEEGAQRVRLREENIARVLINQEGRIALNDEEITYAQLESRIRIMVAENPDLVVSLRSDRRSRYFHMIDALDRLRAAGAEKISLSTH